MTLAWALGERILDRGPQNEASVIKTMTEIKKWSLPDPWVSKSSGKSVPRKSKTFTVAHMFTIWMCQHVHVYTKPYTAILKHRHTGHGNTVDDCKWTSIPKWCNVEGQNSEPSTKFCTCIRFWFGQYSSLLPPTPNFQSYGRMLLSIVLLNTQDQHWKWGSGGEGSEFCPSTVEDLNFCRQYLVFLAWTLIQILVATSGGIVQHVLKWVGH